MHPGGDDVVAASAIMPARGLDQSRVDRSTPLLAQGSRLSKLLAGILVLVLAALLVGWLMRDPSRRKPAVIDGGRGFEMHYSPIQVTVGWIVLGLVSLGCLASRPLDPRFQLPWALATAAILLPLLVWFFDKSLTSEISYEEFTNAFVAGIGAVPGWFIKLVCLGLIWGYLHHFCAGLRHLWMDATHSVSKEQGRSSALLVLGLSLLLTAALGAKLFGLY